MVNLAPSRGCDKCRARHIKCDETRPECDKCKAIGVSCPGYRGGDGWVFKDQTPKLARKHANSVGTVQRNSEPRDPPLDKTKSVVYSDSWCIEFFLRNFVTCSRDERVGRGHFESLASSYSKASPNSPLVLATAALGVRAAAMHFNQARSTSLHNDIASRAASALLSAIQDPVLSKRDETLQAVLLLELASHIDSVRAGDRRGQPQHLNGAVALIQHRGQNTFQSRVSRSLLIATIDYSLHHGDHFNRIAFFEELLESGLASELATNPARDIDILLVRTLCMRARLTALAGVSATVVQLAFLQGMIFQISQGLDRWVKTMPRDWYPVKHPTNPRDPRESWVSTDVAFVFNLWRCTRLFLLKLECFLAIEILRAGGSPISAEVRQTAIPQACALLDQIFSASEFFMFTTVQLGTEAQEQSLSLQQPGVASSSRVTDGRTISKVLSSAFMRCFYLKIMTWVDLVFNDPHLTCKEFDLGAQRKVRARELLAQVRASLVARAS